MHSLTAVSYTHLAFYGLRRSEALGLKWDAIDFQNNTITIRHTVTSCNLDGCLLYTSLFLTANDTEQDMLEGFGVGCDDYIPKPFSIEVLRKKVQAVLKQMCIRDR